MPHVVLVISNERTTAELLGAFLAVDGYQVAIADRRQPLEVQVDTLQPRLVLIDVDHPAGFSRAFVDHARRSGAAVVAYSPSLVEPETRARAAALGLSAFGFPLRWGRFRETIRAAREPHTPESSEPAPDRRGARSTPPESSAIAGRALKPPDAEEWTQLRADVATLRAVLLAAHGARDYDRSDVWAAVARLARRARAVGLPPERFLVLLKGLTTDPPLAELPREERAAVEERVIRRGIDSYYSPVDDQAAST